MASLQPVPPYLNITRSRNLVNRSRTIRRSHFLTQPVILAEAGMSSASSPAPMLYLCLSSVLSSSPNILKSSSPTGRIQRKEIKHHLYLYCSICGVPAPFFVRNTPTKRKSTQYYLPHTLHRFYLYTDKKRKL